MAATLPLTIDGKFLFPLFQLLTEGCEDSEEEDEENDEFMETELEWLFPSLLIRQQLVRTQEYFEYTVPNYNEQQFKRMFRLSTDTFDILVRELAVDYSVRNRSGGRPQLPLEKVVLIAISYFATQQTINSIGDRFHVTDFTVLKCRRWVGRCLMARVKHYIQWPESDEMENIERKFNEKGFPGVIGAVDGTHIRITAPAEEDSPLVYINRKKFSSINCQGTVKDDLMFTDILIGYPGSVHDARVFRNSNLVTNMTQEHFGGELDYHLLGDGGYPLSKHVIIPYRNTGRLSGNQIHFNQLLSGTRQTVERAFGLLKGRFRRLLCVDLQSIEETVDVISTCFILHNIMIMNADLIPITEYVTEDEPDCEIIEDLQFLNEDARPNDGTRKRDRLCRELNNEAEDDE